MVGFQQGPDQGRGWMKYLEGARIGWRSQEHPKGALRGVPLPALISHWIWTFHWPDMVLNTMLLLCYAPGPDITWGWW